MKKLIIFINIFILILIPLFSVNASAEYYNNQLVDQDIRSDAYLLVNTDTNTVVFSQNADKQMKCASLVKIASAAVVVDNCDNLDALVTVSASALKPLRGIYSASCGLEEGEQISVRDLLYCMFLKSANDASNVLAEYIGGSIENFVKMMNDFADKLGCKNTNFTNPHGLDEEGEYSSANDMYLIMNYAMSNSVLNTIAATVDYVVPATNKSEERKLNTSADSLEKGTRYYYDYVKCEKTGMTDEAKRCVAALAVKDAYSYIGIIMGCPNECVDNCGYPDNTALYEVRRLFRWAFNNMKMATISEETDTITDIGVKLAAGVDRVRLVPEKRIQALLLKTVDAASLEFVTEIPESVNAPIKKGDVVGTVSVKYADSVVSKINLVAGDDVERSAVKYLGYIIKKVFTSPFFLIPFAIAVVILVLYFFGKFGKKRKSDADDGKRLKAIKKSAKTDRELAEKK